MPQGAQLFQRLQLFQWCRWQGVKLQQKPDPISIDADMAQRLGQLAALLAIFPPGLACEVACSGDRGAAEIQRGIARIEHHLDHIWIKEIGEPVSRMGRRCLLYTSDAADE